MEELFQQVELCVEDGTVRFTLNQIFLADWEISLGFLSV